MLPTRRLMDTPFSVLREVDRALNRVWSDFEGEGVTPSYGFPVDIREVDDKLIIEAELPGFKKDQIDINVEQGVLSIEAERKDERTDDQKGTSHLSERHYAKLVRRFTLPNLYNTEDVDAKLHDGVLTLTLTKRDEVKPKKIAVK